MLCVSSWSWIFLSHMAESKSHLGSRRDIPRLDLIGSDWRGQSGGAAGFSRIQTMWSDGPLLKTLLCISFALKACFFICVSICVKWFAYNSFVSWRLRHASRSPSASQAQLNNTTRILHEASVRTSGGFNHLIWLMKTSFAAVFWGFGCFWL